MWITLFQTLELGEIRGIDDRVTEHDPTIVSDFAERVENVSQVLSGQASDAGSLAAHSP